jgi:hypothetical protein
VLFYFALAADAMFVCDVRDVRVTKCLCEAMSRAGAGRGQQTARTVTTNLRVDGGKVGAADP